MTSSLPVSDSALLVFTSLGVVERCHIRRCCLFDFLGVHISIILILILFGATFAACLQSLRRQPNISVEDELLVMRGIVLLYACALVCIGLGRALMGIEGLHEATSRRWSLQYCTFLTCATVQHFIVIQISRHFATYRTAHVLLYLGKSTRRRQGLANV
jgi:hypothetical protein